MVHPRHEHTITLNRSRFRRRTGLYPEVFADMLEALHDWHRRKTRAGRPPALRLEVQLMLSLEFWREYRTFSHLGQDCGIHEATARCAVVRVEDALLASGRFSLPGRRQRNPLRTTQKNQKRWYSGKKKRHTLKAQLRVHPVSRAIICTATGQGALRGFAGTPLISVDAPAH